MFLDFTGTTSLFPLSVLFRFSYGKRRRFKGRVTTHDLCTTGLDLVCPTTVQRSHRFVCRNHYFRGPGSPSTERPILPVPRTEILAPPGSFYLYHSVTGNVTCRSSKDIHRYVTSCRKDRHRDGVSSVGRVLCSNGYSNGTR